MTICCCTATSPLIPRTTILASPFQDFNMATLCCTSTSTSFQWQPFSRAHFKTSIWPVLYVDKSSHSKGNHSPEPISRFLNGHYVLPLDKSTRSKCNHSGEPISRLLNIHHVLHYDKSAHSKDNHSVEPILRPLNGHQLMHYDKSTRSKGNHLDEPILRPMTTSCSTATSHLIPSATIIACPLEEWQVSE